MRTFQQPPDLVEYTKDVSLLLFNPELPLHINKPHIIGDARNVARWPEELQGEKNRPLRQTYLEAAEKRMKDRVARNFKVAVPQFYKGQLQLLMPLCLLETRKADLALVVEKEGDAYYGSTVLKISWAYVNARLICRPESDWLNI